MSPSAPARTGAVARRLVEGHRHLDDLARARQRRLGIDERRDELRGPEVEDGGPQRQRRGGVARHVGGDRGDLPGALGLVARRDVADRCRRPRRPCPTRVQASGCCSPEAMVTTGSAPSASLRTKLTCTSAPAAATAGETSLLVTREGGREVEEGVAGREPRGGVAGDVDQIHGHRHRLALRLVAGHLDRVAVGERGAIGPGLVEGELAALDADDRVGGERLADLEVDGEA